MISEYVQAALRRATVERMEDGRFFSRIQGIDGPWADGDTRDACLAQLREVLEEWLVAALRADDELPVIDGVSLNFGGQRWLARSLVESSSAG